MLGLSIAEFQLRCLHRFEGFPSFYGTFLSPVVGKPWGVSTEYVFYKTVTEDRAVTTDGLIHTYIYHHSISHHLSAYHSVSFNGMCELLPPRNIEFWGEIRCEQCASVSGPVVVVSQIIALML